MDNIFALVLMSFLIIFENKVIFFSLLFLSLGVIYFLKRVGVIPGVGVYLFVLSFFVFVATVAISLIFIFNMRFE